MRRCTGWAWRSDVTVISRGRGDSRARAIDMMPPRPKSRKWVRAPSMMLMKVSAVRRRSMSVEGSPWRALVRREHLVVGVPAGLDAAPEILRQQGLGVGHAPQRL